MPTKPKRPCSHPGCPKLTAGRFCEEHEKAEAKRYERYQRDPATYKRYGSAWRKLRKRYIAAHPLCENCLEHGRVTPTQEAHIPNSVYLLDRFHLCKYVLRAVGRYPELKKGIWKAIKQDDIVQVDTILQETLTRAQSGTHKKSITDCFRYIKENWDGIQAYREYPAATGCSAEGHVSHVLSARLSSRPQGWSREGAEKMASLRVLEANGYSIQEEYIMQKTDNTSLIMACEDVIQQQRKLLKKQLLDVVRGNLPTLKRRATCLTKALRGLSYPA